MALSYLRIPSLYFWEERWRPGQANFQLPLTDWVAWFLNWASGCKAENWEKVVRRILDSGKKSLYIGIRNILDRSWRI